MGARPAARRQHLGPQRDICRGPQLVVDAIEPADDVGCISDGGRVADPVEAEESAGPRLGGVVGEEGRVPLPGAGQCAGAFVGVTALERQARPLGGIDDELGRPLEVPARLLVGEAGRRVAGGGLEESGGSLRRDVRDSLGGQPRELGGQQAGPQVGQVGRVHDRRVPRPPLLRRQAVAHRLAHEVVHERVLSRAAAHQRGSLDRGERGVHISTDRRAEERVGRLTPDERRHAQHPPLPVAERVHAAVDSSPHAQRLGRMGERHRLDDEERVAAGQPAQVLGLGRRGRRTELLADPAYAVVVQPGERDGHGLLRQVRERLPQRVVRPRQLVGAVGADHEQRQVHGVAVEERNQGQGRGVRPLEVVDQHDDGTGVAGPGQELERGIEEVELRRRDGFAGVEQPAERAVIWLGRPVLGVERRAQGSEDLHPRPEAGGAGTVPAGAHRRAGAPPARPVEELEGQPRLADAGFAGDEHQPTDPGQGLLQDAGQPPQRLLATDERGRAHDAIVAGRDLAGASCDLAPTGCPTRPRKG